MENQERNRWIFEQACAFADLALLTETENVEFKNRTYSHTYTGISLSAFAIELFLKCLISSMGDEYAKTHSLKHLWNKYYSLDYQNAEIIKNQICADGNYFNDRLSEIDNAFDDWRYIFESRNDPLKINRDFLSNLREILRETCNQELFQKISRNI